MLELKNITKTFTVTGEENKEKIVLDNLSLTINDNDFITIIGSNGSGKSTLLNCIAGTLKVDEGQILLTSSNINLKLNEKFIDKMDISKLSDYKRAKYISRVFQDPMLGTIPDMSLSQNMSLAYRRGKGISFGWAQNKSSINFFKHVLSKLELGLENRLDTPMKNFSGGQRQSVTLLMANMLIPQVLLLDEHTAALDPKTAAKVMKLTNDIVKNKHIPTLMITHNMKDAIKYGNRLIMMDQGKIIYECSGKEKENLTIEFLIEKFNSINENAVISDTVLLN